MSDWQFDQHEVLADDEGYWWHVLDRLESIDGSKQQYELADATHTEYKTLHRDDVEGELGMFTSLKWSTTTKPAADRGYRVNGVLCGRQQIDYWRGTECVHEYSCPDCGREGKTDIDIIHGYGDGEYQWTACECRVCDYVWEATDE